MSVQILPLENLLNLGLKTEDLIPAYGGESAGLDLYNAGPDINLAPATDFTEDQVWNQEYQKRFFKTLMPTGIKVNIPQGFVGVIAERGSITKSVFKVRAGIIDCGYNQEVFVNFINCSAAPATLKAGEKSPFQLLVLQCDNRFVITSKEEYAAATTDSKRQGGQIGSSDKVQ